MWYLTRGGRGWPSRIFDSSLGGRAVLRHEGFHRGRVPRSGIWRKEKVNFSGAYGDVRVRAFVFLPKKARPPYQILVYHPSAGAQTSTFASMEGFNRMEFIVRSGRATI